MQAAFRDLGRHKDSIDGRPPRHIGRGGGGPRHFGRNSVRVFDLERVRYGRYVALRNPVLLHSGHW